MHKCGTSIIPHISEFLRNSEMPKIGQMLVTHLGLDLLNPSEGLKFDHASQNSKMVAETNLLDYITRDREILRVKVIRWKGRWRR